MLLMMNPDIAALTHTSYLKPPISRQEAISLIVKEVFDGYLPSKNDDLETQPLWVVGKAAADLPPLQYPLYVKNGSDEYMISDLRGACELDGEGGVYVTKPLTYEFVFIRGILSAMYASPSTSPLTSIAAVPALALATYLTDALNRGFRLDPYAQASVKAAVVSYILAQTKLDTTDPSELNRLGSAVIQVTGLPPDLVWEVMSKAPPQPLIAGLVEMIKAVGGLSLSKITPAVLVGLFANMYSITDQRLTNLIAVEHPPTLIAEVYVGLRNSMLSRTPLIATAMKTVKRDVSEEFSASVRRTVSRYVKEESLVMKKSIKSGTGATTAI
jgi:hypothetical protein